MNVGEYAIRKKTISFLFIILLTAGGYVSYERLGRLEDPEFTIKEAHVLTPYPGATPTEVEQEVTDLIETAVQQLGQIKRVRSTSRAGTSDVAVEIQDKYNKDSLPQVWDELRRKVNDIQRRLPPGAGPSLVNDDFGDVYGILFALVGDGKGGYSHADLKDYADELRRQLLLVDQVARVAIGGAPDEAVFVEMSRARAAQLGISQQAISDALKQQNAVVPAGDVRVENERIRIDPTGTFKSVEEIGDLLIRDSASGTMVRLRDVATITRGYKEPPSQIIHYDGEPAITIGVSVVSGGNVVEMGDAVLARLKELEPERPLGMRLLPISIQSETVKESVAGFVVNVVEALVIVIVVLLVFMGLRSGLIIGAVLLLTVAGTMIAMDFSAIPLQRISLGALIIALGMLVDNAIVVTEGMLVRIEQGMDRLKAVREVVGQTSIPLLGATAVAILAFAGIGLSKDSTGEYCGSLFWVVLISLFLSWVLAITVTPILGDMFLRAKPGKANSDPYKGRVFQAYGRFLRLCIRMRWMTIGILLVILLLAVLGFSRVEKAFFPASSRPQFAIDVWLTEGTDIRATEACITELETYAMTLDGVEAVASFIGAGVSRFMLTYKPESTNSSYGQLLVSVADHRQIDDLRPVVEEYAASRFPDAETKAWRFELGTGGGSKIQARLSGPDPAVLRRLADQVMDVMHADGGTRNIKHDWRQRVKVVRPQFSEARARDAGVTRPALCNALQQAFTGLNVGLYREGDKLLPIVVRPPELERLNVDNINDIQVWSPVGQAMTPVSQIVTDFKTEWEDAVVVRRDRARTLTVMCDQNEGNASVTFNRIRPLAEAIEMPPGYTFEWGGEYEDSQRANANVAKNLPLTFLTMVVIVIMLFNAVRQPLIIWLCVPMAIIGVAIGLLMTGLPFGFMAILGFLSLTGMLIKNAVVLIDEIDVEIREGKERFQAIVDSSISRMRPVLMAAVTTILGMLPLFFDVFFREMAVTIVFGLAFATVLTLAVVPVLYAIFFRIPYVKERK